MKRLEYNTITTNSERSPDIAVPARPASLRNSSRFIFRSAQPGLLFALPLLHRQSATRRTSRRSVLFLKGNKNVSSCSKSFGLRCDCRRGRLGNSCDVEKFVMASLPEIESIDSITAKLPKWSNNVKKNLCREQKLCVLITN